MTTLALHRGMQAQHGGDFSRFDAIAADFHLLIQSSEKCDLAIGQPARKISGTVHARAGTLLKGFGTKRSAVKLGRFL